MTKRMKHFRLILATLLVGALAISCNEVGQENQIPEENNTPQGPVQMTFKATVAAKGSSTKSVDANGVTTWVVNEQMAVYYQKTNDTYGTATAKVDEVNNGNATISATLTEAKDGGTVKFVYPATLVNATGDDIDAAKLATQHGTIADISLNFDAATASATLQTDGTTCGTTENIRFTNQVFIGKFTPKLSGTSIDGITTLTISDESNTYTVTPSSGTFGTDGIYVAMLPVSDKKLSLSAVTTAQTYLFGGKKVTLSAGKLYNNLAVECYPQTVNLANIDADFTARDGQTLTGTLGGNHKISIADGATVTLKDAYITGLTKGSNYPGITCLGNAMILLIGENGVKGGVGGSFETGLWPGIFIPANHTLTIDGTGTLIVSSGGDIGSKDYAPGIGAIPSYESEVSGADCGDIVIQGGNITAYGGCSSAGIGGTNDHGCGNITITGSANVSATGRLGGTGIGGGYNGTCNNITISSNGTVTAMGGGDAAGIGGGHNGTCNNITISSNGTVTATGGYGSAGIGSGYNGTCNNITISSNGTVTAMGGGEAAGIGTGLAKDNPNQCGNIIIEKGTVIATGGCNGAGIGTGAADRKTNQCGDILISGGSITATGDNYATAIGTAFLIPPGNSTCGTITIENTVTKVTATWGGADALNYIGRYRDRGTCGTVTIDGVPNATSESTFTHFNSAVSNNTWTLTHK